MLSSAASNTPPLAAGVALGRLEEPARQRRLRRRGANDEGPAIVEAITAGPLGPAGFDSERSQGGASLGPSGTPTALTTVIAGPLGPMEFHRQGE
jgi:hypothetical protein